MGGVGARVGESLAAVAALEGFVSGMDPHMLLQTIYILYTICCTMHTVPKNKLNCGIKNCAYCGCSRCKGICLISEPDTVHSILYMKTQSVFIFMRIIVWVGYSEVRGNCTHISARMSVKINETWGLTRPLSNNPFSRTQTQ